MSTKSGRLAEQRTAEYLESHGHKVLTTNWRNRFCEIDLITIKNKTVFIIEVKFRTNRSFGSGLNYVTPKKLQQIQRSASYWVAENEWTGDLRLLAAEVDGLTDEIRIEAID